MASYNTPFSNGTATEEKAGGYEYDFIDAPHPDDYCAICLLPARDPQQTRCECAKLYCKSCYDKQRSTAGTCPTCRQPLDAFPDRNISRRVRSLKVKCTTSADCSWVNELRLLDEHLNTCGYALMPCANGCGDHSVRDKLLHHYTEVCPLRQYTCVYCKEVGTYKEMISSHLDVCPDTMVPCPNSGCGTNIKRRDITSHHSVCPDAMVPCPNSGCEATIKRKDIAFHCSECQYETIGCVYVNIGCTFTSPRHEMAGHKASSSGYHLDLAMVQLKKQEEDPIMQIKELHQKHVEEMMMQHKEQHRKHVEEMLQQKEQHQKHVEEILAQLNEKHPKYVEEIMAQQKEQHQKHVEEIMAQLKKNVEEIMAQQKEQHQKHIEEMTMQQKEQHQKNIEEIMMQQKEQHQKHVEEMIARLNEQHQKRVEEMLQQKEQHQKHVEEIMAQLKEKHQKHMEDIILQQKEQHQKHVEEMIARLKEQHQKHVKEMMAQQKEQHQKHVEEMIARLKEQHQKHVKEMMAQQKEQHQEHVKEIIAQLKEHSDKNVWKMITQVKLQHSKQLEEIKQLKEEKVKEIDKLFVMMEKITNLNPSKEHVVLKMSSFEQHRVNRMAWYSPGFYTHPHGYKMCLMVDANGSGEGEGTHISVFLYPMKGEHDDNLIWPLRYTCTLTLLNQLMDIDHHTLKFAYSTDEMDQHNSRVVATGKNASARTTVLNAASGRGYHQFIAHDQLDLVDPVGQQQYLMDDCLYFRVRIEVLPPPAPWLVPTEFQEICSSQAD